MIHLLSQHLLDPYCVPDLVLGPENTAMNMIQPRPSEVSQSFAGVVLLGFSWAHPIFLQSDKVA